MIFEGRVHKVGDDLDTDVIIPAHLLSGATIDVAELGRHVMEGMDPDFHSRVKPGDVMVGGENFGCGSSREHAVLALIGAGFSAIVAKSFARIFFRNAINQALPIVVCPGAVDAAKDGDRIKVDLEGAQVSVGEKRFPIRPFSKEVQDIFAAGGLVNYVRKTRGRAS